MRGRGCNLQGLHQVGESFLQGGIRRWVQYHIYTASNDTTHSNSFYWIEYGKGVGWIASQKRKRLGFRAWPIQGKPRQLQASQVGLPKVAVIPPKLLVSDDICCWNTYKFGLVGGKPRVLQKGWRWERQISSRHSLKTACFRWYMFMKYIQVVLDWGEVYTRLQDEPFAFHPMLTALSDIYRMV